MRQSINKHYDTSGGLLGHPTNVSSHPKPPVSKEDETMKHTKGKWFVRKARFNANISKCTVEVKGKTRDLMIARCGFNEANANLIASAPEMLEALYNAQDALYRSGGDQKDIQAIWAVINNAEGGE